VAVVVQLNLVAQQLLAVLAVAEMVVMVLVERKVVKQTQAVVVVGEITRVVVMVLQVGRAL